MTTTTQPITYDVKEAKIKELSIKRDSILAEYQKNKDIDPVKKGKREAGKLRISIEKRRKELKSEALEYGRQVDNLAKEVSEPVNAIESSYGDVIAEYDAELERLAREAREKEEARIAAIQDKLNQIKELCIFSYGEIHTSNDVLNRIDALIKMKSDNFDYQEFTEEFIDLYKSTMSELESNKQKAVEFERKQAEVEAQREKDEEDRRKLETERAEFERMQAEANAKIDAERQALEVEKRAEQEKIRQAEIQKEREELERQRAIDAENRKKAEDAEKARLEQIAKEEAERKAKQESEDRIRNAAPQLFEALELMVKCAQKQNWQDNYPTEYSKSINAIKLAKGEK